MPLSILPAPCTLSALVQFGHPAAQYIQKAWICLRFGIWHLDSAWWESGFKDTKPMDKPYKQTTNQSWIVIIHELVQVRSGEELTNLDYVLFTTYFVGLQRKWDFWGDGGDNRNFLPLWPCGLAWRIPGDLCDMDVLRIHPSVGIGGILPLVFRASAFHLCFVFFFLFSVSARHRYTNASCLAASVRKQRCCFFGGLRFGLRNIGCSRPTNRWSWLRSPQYKGAVYLW